MGTENFENDIMAEEPKQNFSLIGHTKKAKIINISMLVLLAGVIVWCIVGA